MATRPLKFCTIMPIDLSHREDANLHALEVNPANLPAFDSSDPKSAAMDTRRRWPNGMTLRIRFLGGDPVVQQRVQETAETWLQVANIKFAFGNDPDAEIRVAFDRRSGSWSYVGTDCSLPILRDKPTMNLGWLLPSTSTTEYKRVVLHEFGHALGLIHEHLSPGATIPWNEAAVIEYYRRTNGWDPAYTRSNVLTHAYADAYTRFDPKSIMLYPIPAALLTDPKAAVPWSNSELSDEDKRFIGQMYPFAPIQ